MPVRTEATVWIQRESAPPIEVRFHAGMGVLRVASANGVENAAMLRGVDDESFGMGAVHAPRETKHLVAQPAERVLHLSVSVGFGERRVKIEIELVVTESIAV